MTETVMLRGAQHVVTECGDCGVVYTVPKIVYESHWQEGGYHSCPNGHQRGWSKDRCERELLRQDRDRLKQQLACKDDEIAAQRRALADAEANAARLRKRAAAGVCPCCTRSFTNLRRHIASKHPDYSNGAVSAVARQMPLPNKRSA